MWIKNEAYNQGKKSLHYLYSAPIGFQIFQKHSIPWGGGEDKNTSGEFI